MNFRSKLLLFILFYLIMPIGAVGYSSIEYSVLSDKSVTFTVPNTFEKEELSTWKNIGYFLTHSNYSKYTMRWGGFGGFVFAGKEFIQDIQQAQSQGKEIDILEVGDSYSMHSMVLCYADHVYDPDNFFRMFHAEGNTVNGKQYRSTKETTEMGAEFNTCVSKGLISSSQLDYLWQGNEVYLSNTNVWYFKDLRIPEHKN